jgi:hypothetical protein
MNLPQSVVYEPWDVNRRLSELEVTEETLRQSALAGFAAWASCTENHPPAHSGFVAWGETVRALRDRLGPLGWRRLNEANLALVINESGTTAISVATGTEQTGREKEQPQTGSAKGAKTAGAVQLNVQDILFPEWAQEISRSSAKGRSTWIFLVYRDRSAMEVRCELSRPISMNDDGYVNGWHERIILKPLPFDGAEIKLSDNAEISQTPEIVVEIKKRA